MKVLFGMALSMMLCTTAMAQTFYEPCNYTNGSNLVGNVHATDSVWQQIAAATGTATNVVLSADSLLSFPGYNNSLGNTIFNQFPITGGGIGQSVGLRFGTASPYYLTGSTPGTAYLSFLVNMTRTTSNTLPFMSMNVSTGTYRARICAKRGSPATSFQFGVGHQSTTANNTFTTTAYPQGKVYLLVVKYIKTATGLSDTMKLFVFPASAGAPTVEPETADAVYSEAASFIKPDINGIGIYGPNGANGSGENTRVYIDDIRMSTTWSSSVAMPISLQSFSANRTEAGIQLKWSTASETNSSHFDILRSYNGRDFTGIASVNASGTTSNSKDYGFLDKSATKGIVYYRLKQVDKDGKEKLFQIVVVKEIKGANKLTVYADRATGATASIYAERAVTVTIRIHGIMGQLLATKQVLLQPGNNVTNVNIPALKSGTYIASISSVDGLATTKFICP